MQWNDLPESELARQLKAKALEHPTNAAFDSQPWRSAFKALAAPTERDIDLTHAAIYFGEELAELRQTGIPLTIEGFNRPRLVRLLAAYANQQYLTLRDKITKGLKAQKDGGVFDMERAQQLLVEGAGGQDMTPDDLITYLVDSLPHWLFHIWQVPDDAPSHEPQEAIQFAAQASQIVSIEHSLRQLWLNARWIGTMLFKDGEALVDTPRDHLLAERWFIFDQRQVMLMMAEHNIDAGASIVAGGKLPPIVPAIPRTVIRMERPPSGHRKFITGRASGAKREQREHVSERDMLDRLYTGLFMDESLPNSPGGQLTCRELNAAWWVLKDLARLAADDLGLPWMADDKAVGRFALTIERKNLIALLSDCLGIDPDRAGGIVNWFTCDPADTARIFAKSFWSEPLLPEPGSERCHIVLAPLLVGSPVKRIETWMERGGISDNRGIKGRGKPFERHVRTALAAAVADNQLLTDTVVAEHGLKRKNNSEEIDLLVRVGDTVIVGEVKCFVAPSEPIEKHNHLVNLAKATAQAEHKRVWAEDNRDAIAGVLGINDPARAATLTIRPLVVLNHGFGMGLERDGVPIVDLHYLRLLLSGGSYQGDTRFERGIGVAYQSVELYKSQTDFQARLDDLLRDPPPLKRYEGTLRWRRIPFPTSNGMPFFIELPTLGEVPLSNALRDMPPYEARKRRR
ncbi:MAG: hypothetical protein H7X93_12730 [Sphingomonadaceae bacterium]|nr:hypothetical protein [Sphingomonadaceae bacterium]